LVEKKRRNFLAAQVGRAISALTLDETNEGARLALSSHYLRVALPGSPVAPNTLLDLHVGRVADGILYAYPVASQVCASRTQAGATSLAPNPR
jgi:hypothetical protein